MVTRLLLFFARFIALIFFTSHFLSFFRKTVKFDDDKKERQINHKSGVNILLLFVYVYGTVFNFCLLLEEFWISNYSIFHEKAESFGFCIATCLSQCKNFCFVTGVIQQLRRQEGMGRWSVKCLRGLDRYI